VDDDARGIDDRPERAARGVLEPRDEVTLDLLWCRAGSAGEDVLPDSLQIGADPVDHGTVAEPPDEARPIGGLEKPIDLRNPAHLARRGGVGIWSSHVGNV
jgi:hypothetical protein